MVACNSKDIFQLVFGQNVQSGCRQSQPVCAQADLLNGFFTTDVQGIEHVIFGQGREYLEQQCGLAYARVATQQDHGTADQSTTQGTIKFSRPGSHARLFHQVYFIELAYYCPGRAMGLKPLINRGPFFDCNLA